jgi:hypothetical protein
MTESSKVIECFHEKSYKHKNYKKNSLNMIMLVQSRISIY